MDVFRAPIHTEHISMQVQEDKRPKTRSGYLVNEAYSCYEKSLGEVGTSASGKALHFAADIVCSGGLDIWIRGAYSYAVQHIGLANPRIFVYLRQRVVELDKRAASLPQESFYSHPEVQSNIAECVLVLQLCPKRAKLVWPKIDANTKRPGWLRGVAGSPETRATRVVWSSDADTPPLYLVSNELCKAVQDGAQERALFWIRWTMEEDSRIRKETKSGMSTKERGGATGGRAKTEAGHFLASVLYEIYKELSSKNLIRMNEEFSELYRLWRGGEIRMAANLRRDCLGLMAIICCEVPRWKVPAAPSLVADPIRLSRAVSQCGSFFNEVLANSMAPEKQIKASMTKVAKQRKAKALSEKETKELTMEDKFSEYDAVMEAYLNKF